MKKLMFLLVFIQLFSVAILHAQNITVAIPANIVVKIAPDSIENVVQRNFQQLKLNNKLVRIFYTKDPQTFIIAKISRFTYSVSFLLIKVDGNLVTVKDPNFISHVKDFELYTQSSNLHKTLTTYDFLFDTPCDYIQSAVDGINSVSGYATNQNYSVTKMLGSQATISNVENAINSNDLIAMGNIGHGNIYGIQLYDGFLDYTWFASQDLSNKIFFFNSCEVANEPMVSAMMDDGNARTYTGGYYDLPIGTSELVFQDFFDYTLNDGIDMNTALNDGMVNHSLQYYYRIFGDLGIMNLTTSGTLRGNETWSGTVNVTGNLTVPSGKTLTIQPGANITFNNNSSLTVNGTLTANGNSSSTPITFDFISPNSSTQNGIIFNSGSSGTINYCQIRNAYRGIYENSVSVGISNSAISGCTDGIYLYSSNPLIQYCNIHNNSFAGINLTYSSPTIMWSNYIHNNVDGVYCSSSSAPQFGDGVYGGENNIRDNTYGVVAWNNANPMLGNTSPSDGGYNNLVNTSFNVYNMTSNVIYARENWWGTTDPNNFKNSIGVSSSPYLTSELYIPSPPLSKATGNLAVSSSEDIPMLSELDKAYKLADAGNLEEARNICMNLITNYPDYSVSYNALNLLKDTYDAKDLTGKKNIYASLFNSKAKKNIHAMAGLILAHVDKENKLKHIDDVLAGYGDDNVAELALYDKFVYFYFDKGDIENAKAISGQLDKQFPGTQASIEAHRVLGDKEYYNASPKQESSSTANKEKPKEFKLSDNYPNPFNPSTTIHYEIPRDGYVSIKVYDMLGKEVAALVDRQQTQGVYNVSFDASGLSSGIYFYKLSVTDPSNKSNNFISTKKMMLLK